MFFKLLFQLLSGHFSSSHIHVHHAKGDLGKFRPALNSIESIDSSKLDKPAAQCNPDWGKYILI